MNFCARFKNRTQAYSFGTSAGAFRKSLWF